MINADFLKGAFARLALDGASTLVLFQRIDPDVCSAQE